MLANEAMQQVIIRAVRIGSRVAAKAQEACMQSASNKAVKVDASPVTVGDFAVQACVSHVLAESYPDIMLLAEEDDETFKKLSLETQEEITRRVNEALPELKADTNRVAQLIGRGSFGKRKEDVPPCFVLDPIDGTKGFLRGEQYAICLGFLEANGTASIGALGCPNMPLDFFDSSRGTGQVGFLFEAQKGTGMRMRKLFLDPDESDVVLREWNREKILPSPPREELRFAESYEKSHTAGHLNQMLFERYSVDEDRILRIDSQVKFAALSRGDVHVYFRFTSFDICTWDVLPGLVVITEAGGRVTDKKGKDINLNLGRSIKGNSIIATGPGLSRIHDDLIACIGDCESQGDKSGIFSEVGTILKSACSSQ